MPKTQAEKMWVLGAFFVALVMALIGYMFFISPQNSSTASARSDVSAAQADNQRLQVKLDGLRSQAKNMASYQAELKNAQLALPNVSGLSDFLRSLQGIGNATLANVSGLTVGVPADVTSAASGATTKAAAVPPATTATSGAGHVYALPITANVSGSPAQLNAFLTQLQSVQPRAVVITQLQLGTPTNTVAKASSAMALQLWLDAFVAPTSSAETAQLAAAANK